MKFPTKDLVRIRAGDLILVPPGSPLCDMKLATLSRLGLTMSYSTRTRADNKVEDIAVAFSAGPNEMVLFLVTCASLCPADESRRNALALMDNTPTLVESKPPAVRSAKILRIPLSGPVDPKLGFYILPEMRCVAGAGPCIQRSVTLAVPDTDCFRRPHLPDAAGSRAWRVQSDAVYRNAVEREAQRTPLDSFHDACCSGIPWDPDTSAGHRTSGTAYAAGSSELYNLAEQLAGARSFCAPPAPNPLTVTFKFLRNMERRGAVAVSDPDGAAKMWLARRAMSEAASSTAKRWRLRLEAMRRELRALAGDAKAAAAAAAGWNSLSESFGRNARHHLVVQGLEKAAKRKAR